MVLTASLSLTPKRIMKGINNRYEKRMELLTSQLNEAKASKGPEKEIVGEFHQVKRLDLSYVELRQKWATS